MKVRVALYRSGLWAGVRFFDDENSARSWAKECAREASSVEGVRALYAGGVDSLPWLSGKELNYSCGSIRLEIKTTE